MERTSFLLDVNQVRLHVLTTHSLLDAGRSGSGDIFWIYCVQNNVTEFSKLIDSVSS
jgi:hypothetical protein